LACRYRTAARMMGHELTPSATSQICTSAIAHESEWHENMGDHKKLR